MTLSDFAMTRTCRECPWKRSTPLGKFPPARYKALAETANRSSSLTFRQPVFACHMSPEGGEKACAGFMLVVGFDNINVRLAGARKQFDMREIQADGELYESFDEMARANGHKPRRRA